MDGAPEWVARHFRDRAHFQRRRGQRLVRGREETDAAPGRMRVHAAGDGEFRGSPLPLPADEDRRRLGAQPARRLQLPLVQPRPHSHSRHHGPVGDIPLRDGESAHAPGRLLDLRLLAAPPGRQPERAGPRTPGDRHRRLVAVLEHGTYRGRPRPVRNGQERHVHRLSNPASRSRSEPRDSPACR